MTSERRYEWIAAGAGVTLAYLTLVLGLVALAGCDEGSTTAGPPPPTTPVRASDWVASADWAAASVVEVRMVEQGGSYAFSPSQLTFEAGKPYILRLLNPASNVEKHYFATEGLGDFYRAIATRKIETVDAEYKAPHFDAVELMVGGRLDLFFVPVIAGSYDILCTIPGHKEGGMFGSVTITGGEGYQLDLEVAADFDRTLASDPRKSSSHAVWGSRVDTSVTLAESPAYAFAPPNLALVRGTGYKIVLASALGNAAKHYYTAPQFYKNVVTRKVEDTQAEIKAPYLNAVELMPGKQASLFMVPTVAGTFDTTCTIPGHAERGMTGTIVVSP